MNRHIVVEFRNSLAGKNAPSTVNADFKCVKMAFRAAKRDGYLLEDPAEVADTVRTKPVRRGSRLLFQKFSELLEAADPEWKSLTLFELYTGKRLADLAVLTWDNVDLLKNEIRLRTRKNWQTA